MESKRLHHYGPSDVHEHDPPNVAFDNNRERLGSDGLKAALGGGPGLL
jgi:hypothetical protein